MADNQETAAWDARQQFVKELEDLDQRANQFKLIIENRPSPNEIIRAFQVYFSTLRWLYRMIKNYTEDTKVEIVVSIDKKTKKVKREKIGIKKAIKNLRRRVNGFVSRNKNAGMVRERITVPLSLEDDLENLHDTLNKVRHDKGLVMPTRSIMRLDPEEAALRGMNA